MLWSDQRASGEEDCWTSGTILIEVYGGAGSKLLDVPGFFKAGTSVVTGDAEKAIEACSDMHVEIRSLHAQTFSVQMQRDCAVPYISVPGSGVGDRLRLDFGNGLLIPQEDGALEQAIFD